MFLKSLQLKLILIFFILISTTVLGIGVYSIKKVEEVYYNGFIEEMLNTISSFGLNIKHIKDEETKRTDESLNVGKDFINSNAIYGGKREPLAVVYDQQRLVYINLGIGFINLKRFPLNIWEEFLDKSQGAEYYFRVHDQSALCHFIEDKEIDELNVDFETAIMTPVINWWKTTSPYNEEKEKETNK